MYDADILEINRDWYTRCCIKWRKYRHRSLFNSTVESDREENPIKLSGLSGLLEQSPKKPVSSFGVKHSSFSNFTERASDQEDDKYITEVEYIVRQQFHLEENKLFEGGTVISLSSLPPSFNLAFLSFCPALRTEMIEKKFDSEWFYQGRFMRIDPVCCCLFWSKSKESNEPLKYLLLKRRIHSHGIKSPPKGSLLQGIVQDVRFSSSGVKITTEDNRSMHLKLSMKQIPVWQCALSHLMHLR